MLNVGKFYTDLTFSLLSQPVNQLNRMHHTDFKDVNAYYYFEENSIGE